VGRAATIGVVVLATLLATPPEAPARRRPNVVVITTDDQTADSLDAMPRTLDVLVEHGTTFTDAVASFPLCAPSRATVLTAQYMHNHGVRLNSGPNGGYQSLDHARVLPVRLQAHGYYTAHVGKYLNGYGQRDAGEVPPGYDSWFGLIGPTTYSVYDYAVNDDGTVRQFGTDASAYQTDVLAERAESVIRAAARSNRPFFVHVAPVAPHWEALAENGFLSIRPPRPAPRHLGFFAGVPLPASPAFNEADVTDKPAFIQALPLLDADAVTAVTASYRARLEALLAVDELVQRVVDALETSNALDDTVIVFTSDNGYLLGEHRVSEQKRLHYGPSLRVPLVIRGPGFPRGVRRTTVVGNADLGATIARLTRSGRAADGDGRRLGGIARAASCAPAAAVLLEGGPAPDPSDEQLSAVGVRTQRYRYTEYFTGERELYDLEEDPFELESRHARPDPETEQVRASLARLLEELRACAGRACRPAPRLRLRLTDGAAGTRVRVTGGDRSAVRSLEFVVDGRPKVPASGSLRLRLARPGVRDVWARVELWDGRVLGLAAPGRSCRAPRDVGS
jgi:arylsulfatase A-like enzyme